MAVFGATQVFLLTPPTMLALHIEYAPKGGIFFFLFALENAKTKPEARNTTHKSLQHPKKKNVSWLKSILRSGVSVRPGTPLEDTHVPVPVPLVRFRVVHLCRQTKFCFDVGGGGGEGTTGFVFCGHKSLELLL